jgi:hypothetical protein
MLAVDHTRVICVTLALSVRSLAVFAGSG